MIINMKNDDVSTIAKKMGDNLRSFRIKNKHGTQATMAFRIGVSERTYAKMEQGDPSVSLLSWLTVAVMFGQHEGFTKIMSSTSLFDQLPCDVKIPQRYRK